MAAKQYLYTILACELWVAIGVDLHHFQIVFHLIGDVLHKQQLRLQDFDDDRVE